jgi:hypothetical protein
MIKFKEEIKMDKIWCNKTVKSLTNEEKENILNIVIDACTDNEMFADMGEVIFDYLKKKKVIWEEEVED